MHCDLTQETHALVQKVLERGGDPNMKDLDGNAPLHFLAKRSRQKGDAAPQIAKLLVEYKGDLYALNEAGETSLQLVMAKRDP